MDIKKLCEKALFRYDEKSKFLLSDSLSFNENMLSGKFICYQPYLKSGEKSAAMNNTDFMTLSNQACYLIIYCYFIEQLDYTLEEVVDLHGNIAVYKQSFFFKDTVALDGDNKFQATIYGVKKRSLNVSVEVNDGDYTTDIKLVLLKKNIHF
ncbi:hypothetical protein ACP6PL_01465 [Dapis sp. BLCC M126]